MVNIRQLARACTVGCAVLASVLFAASATALNLVVEPIHNPERSRAVHKPLVAYLRDATGLDIKLVTPESFHSYWIALREKDDYDLVYDAPHITDFLIERRDYLPLVKTTNPTSFTLVAGYTLEQPTLDAVFGRTVVTMSAPSMGYMLLMSFFPNPLRQPAINSAAQSWEDAVQMVFDQQADAAMLPTWMAKRYPQLVPIKQSEEYPGKALSASPNVSQADRDAIRKALLELNDSDRMPDIRVEMEVDGFEPAAPEDFKGDSKLLDSLLGFSLDKP